MDKNVNATIKIVKAVVKIFLQKLLHPWFWFFSGLRFRQMSSFSKTWKRLQRQCSGRCSLITLVGVSLVGSALIGWLIGWSTSTKLPDRLGWSLFINHVDRQAWPPWSVWGARLTAPVCQPTCIGRSQFGRPIWFWSVCWINQSD